MDNSSDKFASNKNLPDTSKNSPNSQKTNKERREEYFNQLRAWITMMNIYQHYYNNLQQICLQNQFKQLPNDPKETPEDIPKTVPEMREVIHNDQIEGIQCRIPSLWKRFLAEIIDNIIYYFLEFLFAFLFNSIYIYKYNIIVNHILMMSFTMDFSQGTEILLKLLKLELANRLLPCFCELPVLSSPPYYGVASIGKMLLDLTIVKVDKLYHIRGQPANVIAITDDVYMTWESAAYRTMMKNYFFCFIPLLSLFYADFNQNRSAYDVLSGTMVVEKLQPLKCKQSDLISI